jgi:hypothetical protein
MRTEYNSGSRANPRIDNSPIMLPNSYQFIFGFLPAVCVAYLVWLRGIGGRRAGMTVLAGGSGERALQALQLRPQAQMVSREQNVSVLRAQEETAIYQMKGIAVRRGGEHGIDPDRRQIGEARLLEQANCEDTAADCKIACSRP